MVDKIITLPIIIKRTDDSDYPYFIKIPDIDGMTKAKTLQMLKIWQQIILELIH